MTAINAISILVYLLLCLLLLRSFRDYQVLLGYLFVLQAWAILSCFYNDLGIFNSELFRFTHQSFATTRLALFYVVFGFGILVASLLVNHIDFVRIQYRFLFMGRGLFPLARSLWLFLLCLVCFLVFLGLDFETAGGLHRKAYFDSAPFAERFLISYAFLVAFSLGLLRGTPAKVTLPDLVFFLLGVYLILAGNKFSALLVILVCYMTPPSFLFFRHYPQVRLFTPKVVVLSVIAVGVILLVKYFSYVSRTADLGFSVQLLVDRIFAFQGQLWWAVDQELFIRNSFDPSHWRDELSAILNGNGASGHLVGIKYVMTKVLGEDVVRPIFGKGYLYTMAYPAILLLTFSYVLALGVQFISGMLFFMLIAYLRRAIINDYFVRSILCFTILFPFLISLLNGNIAIFLTAGLLAKLLLVFICESIELVTFKAESA